MIYPNFFQKGDLIALPAPSNGVKQEDILKYQNALNNLKKLGLQIVESKNAFNTELMVSASPNVRAKEFSNFWKDENIKGMISVAGGEFMCEILPFLKDEELKKVSPKFFCGFSDNTILVHYLLTHLDTSSIYGYNVGFFGLKKWHQSNFDLVDCLFGKKQTFCSYKTYQDKRFENHDDEIKRLNLTKKTKWINAQNQKKIEINGRMIGGCLDVLLMFLGTPFDKTKEFLKKYEKEGFIWYLESCDLNAAEMKRVLWQLKHAGWFENVKGFIFGRPLVDEHKILNYNQTVMEVLKDFNVPIIFGANIGHKPPTIPIINGSVANIVSYGGQGKISYKLI